MGLLHAYAADVAERDPQRPALVTDDHTLSYRDLIEASTRVARALAAAGIEHGDRVVVYAPKNVQAIVGIYGILTAGAAYVPVDPNAPKARVERVIQDCSAKGLIVGAPQSVRVGERDPLRVCMDVDSLLDLPNGSTTLPDVDDRDLAYIVYTSGSTGAPKGVMRSHRSSSVLVDWVTSTLPLDGNDRFAGYTPLHFGPHRFDLYASAKLGASLHPISTSDMTFAATIARFVEARRLTVWWSAASALMRWVTQGGVEPAALSSLRVVAFGVERFPARLLRKLVELIPAATVFGYYGSSEAGSSLYQRVGDYPLREDGPYLLGRPCELRECLVVTEREAIAGTGERGELYVSEPGLMDGYWNQPALTAEVLVPHPTRPGGDTCYRTGDLVVRDEAGAIRLIGRIDEQIKIRGHRIEPAEIEAAFDSHPSVHEVCVVGVTGRRRVGELVAYVCAPEMSSPRDLKRHVAEILPPYMVPTRIYLTGPLPRTHTGKIDRAEIARSAEGRSVRGTSFV